MRIGIRNAAFLCTALALAFFMSSLRAHAAGPASAQLSSSATLAGPVPLTVPLTTELRCGRLMGRRTLDVALPSKARVAAAVPASALKVGCRAAREVSVSGTYSVKVADGSETFAAQLKIHR